MNDREIRDGAPTAMQLRADLIPNRANRAAEEHQDPFEVQLTDNSWARVVDAETHKHHVHLTVDRGRGGDQLDALLLAATDVIWARWGLGTGQEWVAAHELREGDIVHNLGEAGIPWRVLSLTDRPGEGPARGTTWVVASGDNDEGYYAKWYGGDTQYLAHMYEPVAVSWPRPGDEEE